MKVFISQPMKGLKDSDILKTRKEVIKYIEENFSVKEGEEIEFIDSFFQSAPADKQPLWFLGKSFELLSTADVCVFVEDWSESRGCIMEHEACKRYGIPTKYVVYNAENKLTLINLCVRDIY